MLFDAAIKPQKKKTMTNVAKAPVFVGCLTWFISNASIFELSAESTKFLLPEKFFHCLTLHLQNLPKLNLLFTQID